MFLRVFFGLNVLLWCVLFLEWLVWIGTQGFGGPESVRIGLILGVTAVLLETQWIIRWRRRRRIRVTA